MQTASGTTHDLRPAFMWAMVRLLLAGGREGVGPGHNAGEEKAAMEYPTEIESFRWLDLGSRGPEYAPAARSPSGRPVQLSSPTPRDARSVSWPGTSARSTHV